MNDYIKVDFNINPNDEIQADVLSALLCDAGYESFETTASGLNAYISKSRFDSNALPEILSGFEFTSAISWSEEEIVGVDWNEEWEKHYFTPMIIADECVIHSTFHTEYPKLKYDIVIDPKMAFGTGHHETTSLMVEQILNENLKSKSVLDMGTGTGILAIIASKCGCKDVTGIEIDEAAYVNALENLPLNNVENADVKLGDATLLVDEPEKDVILANINRNIITNDIDKYCHVLKKGGIMLLSGFYVKDIPVIMEVAEPLGLEKVGYKEKNNWAMLKLRKL